MPPLPSPAHPFTRPAIGCLSLLITASLLATDLAAQPVTGWLHWRGPNQNGASAETGLPERWQPGGANHLWSLDLPSRGSVVGVTRPDGDRAYVWGYTGQGADLVETLRCIDPDTGRTLWSHDFPDFLSDIIYNRYSIGAPTVDRETGRVYLMTSPGLLLCFDDDGELLWQRSLLEAFGRLTFPNGRTGAPAIVDGLVIVNCISSNWGAEGPGRNRFYAFDKNTGEHVWSSTPGVGPPFLKDSSFSSPVFEVRDGRRVFYAGTGCGNVVAVNAQTGEPMWRYQLAVGGVNATPVLHGDKLIAIHGVENVDDSGRGEMIAIDLNSAMRAYRRAAGQADFQGPLQLDNGHVLWRNDLSMFTSSPTVGGDRIYQCTSKGELVTVDPQTGRVVQTRKLSESQLHASPLYADGKLYVPFWSGDFYILRATDDGVEELEHVELAGDAIGSPTVLNGRVFVTTTEKVYCFGRATASGKSDTASLSHGERGEASGYPASLQIIPGELLLRPGDAQAFRVRELNAAGWTLREADAAELAWSKFVPPTARVQSYLDAEFDGSRGVLIVPEDAKASAGAIRAERNGVSGTARGRVLPAFPYEEGFEGFELSERDASGGAYAYPPLPWIGARLKWEVRELDGQKVLAKTLDRVLFMRSMVVLGSASDSGYTIRADVRSDGNRRQMSVVGVINQRYVVALDGNKQELTVVSNYDRVDVSTPFAWRPNRWYTIEARVEVNADGSGVVRAKAWERGGQEPSGWTLEAEVPHAHRSGSPGLYGFSPQSRFAVYIDNVRVTPNGAE